MARSISVIPAQEVEHRDIPLLLCDEKRNHSWSSQLTIRLVAHYEAINTAPLKRVQLKNHNLQNLIPYAVGGGPILLLLMSKGEEEVFIYSNKEADFGPFPA